MGAGADGIGWPACRRLPALGPEARAGSPSRQLLFAAIAIAGTTLTGAWTGPGAGIVAAAGWLLVALGAALAGAGLGGPAGRGRAHRGPASPRSARLVEAGAYRLVRHPIYGGLILGAAGWALLRGSLGALVGAAALLVFFDLKRRREEAWLASRYPGYAAYRARTRRLIPWIY